MKLVLRFSLILFLLVAYGPPVYATHLRAGQITAIRDMSSPSTLTYIFTLTLYRDARGAVDQPNAELVFVPIINNQRRPEIGRLTVDANSSSRVEWPDIEEIIYTFRYIFPGAGQYVVYFQEENRNAEIVNMNNSVNTPFYVETILTINESQGINNTPVLRNPPIDGAEVGQRFCHNPAAFDTDGDSLAYRMVVPRQNVNLQVNGYRSPEAVGPPLGVSEANGAPTFVLDPFTGQICWDAPGMFGIDSKGFAEYNIAFVVEEWRNTLVGPIKIGEVVRDMQITVRDQPNKRPELVIPKDTILIAGAAITTLIKATDPDTGQQIRISSESAIFSQERSIFPHQPSAVLSYDNYPPKSHNDYMFLGNPAQNQFSWQTSCELVRNQPYDILFTAQDNASNPFRLTDSKLWRVTIIGTAPTNVQAKAGPSNQSIQVSWDTYSCNTKTLLYIWRKEGCTDGKTGAYSVGIPTGYTFAGVVNATSTTFTDPVAKPGVSYHYLISASMANTIHSLSSPTSCISLAVSPNAPIVTLTSPVNNAFFIAPASITIAVNATDVNGSITKIELYNNGTKIGEDDAYPYSFEWNRVPLGRYSLTAKAIDNSGAIAFSVPVEITVTDIINGSEEEEEKILLTYPNPFQSEIRIRYTHPIREVTLVSLLGVTTMLTLQPMNNHVYTASTGNLPAGVYVLKVRNERGREIIRKLVKL